VGSRGKVPSEHKARHDMLEAKPKESIIQSSYNEPEHFQ
jgi:hypothetical protein